MADSTNFGIRNKYVELPISVANAWESYAQVANAIDELTVAGVYLGAALLTQALFSDDRVGACLDTRTNGIFGLPMEFKYVGQDDEDSGDPANVMALKEHIRDVTETHWEDILPGAAAREMFRWGTVLNMGVSELVWRWLPCDEEVDPDGLQICTLKVWNSQFVYWRWDTRSFWINHTGGTTEIVPGSGEWVMYMPFGHNHGWLYGLVNSLGWLYLDRIHNQRAWARMCEKFSLGLMMADVPADADGPDKVRFTQALQNVSNETTIMTPVTKTGQKFHVEMVKTDAATGWETFLNRKKSIDTDIAIRLLGQNLTTEMTGGGGSGGGGGSRAASKTHDDIRKDILKADVEIWTSTIKTQVLTPFVERNWGHIIRALNMDIQDFVPNVTHVIEPPEDKLADTQAIGALALAIPVLDQAGADIEALLEKFDIPLAEGKKRRSRPPPSGTVNERPGTPGWGLGEDDVLIEYASPEIAAKFLNRGHLKGHSLKGQLAIDQLTDGLRDELKNEMAPTVVALKKIIATSSSYAEMRKRVIDLYRDWDPSDVRNIVERSVIAAQLIGRVTSAKGRN
jgi:hypothetical protein